MLFGTKEVPLSLLLTNLLCFFVWQMHVQLGEISQPVWIEFTHTLNQIADTDPILIKSGVMSDDKK
jgi:hypothetical protein